MGHMNTIDYAGRFDEASWQLLSFVGLTATRLREGRCRMAAVEQNIRYLHELHAGDPITVRSWIVDVTQKSLRLRHEMTNDDRQELVATSEIVVVHFDATIRKSRQLPIEVFRRALAMVEAFSADLKPQNADRKKAEDETYPESVVTRYQSRE
jgi:acyl-CoA thioester hydrolase